MQEASVIGTSYLRQNYLYSQCTCTKNISFILTLKQVFEPDKSHFFLHQRLKCFYLCPLSNGFLLKLACCLDTCVCVEMFVQACLGVYFMLVKFTVLIKRKIKPTDAQNEGRKRYHLFYKFSGSTVFDLVK